MKIFVVDTNIVFSGILNPKSRIGQTLIDPPQNVEFYSTTFLQSEILEHRPKLLKLTKLAPAELQEIESLVTQNIQFVDENLVIESFLEQAEELVADIDLDDALFLALALQLDCKLWTGDKKLREGLRKKGFFNILNTEELIELTSNLD